MRDVKKIERKLCLTNSAAAKICSIANKKGEEKNKIKFINPGALQDKKYILWAENKFIEKKLK